jgi:hypothetical protein
MQVLSGLAKVPMPSHREKNAQLSQADIHTGSAAPEDFVGGDGMRCRIRVQRFVGERSDVGQGMTNPPSMATLLNKADENHQAMNKRYCSPANLNSFHACIVFGVVAGSNGSRIIAVVRINAGILIHLSDAY